MMHIERCTDVGLIRSIMAHPRIYPWISDDSCPDAEDFEPVIHASLYYLVPFIKKPIGVFFYHQHNAVTFEVHTCVLPQFWGETARRAAISSMRWMVDFTPAKKIITHVPERNQLALRFARRCGLRDEGINRKSFLKKGILQDQFLLGITGAEICQQPSQ